MPTYLGTAGVQLLREDLNHVYGQGWFTSREYYGPVAGIAGLMRPLAEDGWEFDIRNEGPYSRLTATRQAQPEDPTTDYYDRYTITTETIEKDIWTLEAVHQEANDPTKYNGDLEALKDTVQSCIDDGTESFISGLDEAIWPATWGAYRELARGVESYEEEYLVLTRERVVSYLYGQKLDIPALNASSIYSTDLLKATFNIPNLTGIDWPDVPTTLIPNTRWGWRHRRRDVQFMEGQKVQIIQDWAWAAWSTNIYSFAG